MLRRSFTLASAGSLLLCSAAVALWVRSCTGPQVDFFVVLRPDCSYGLGTERAGLIGFLQREAPSFRDGDAGDAWISAAGFRYVRISSDGMRRRNLVLPFWLISCAAAIPPLWMGLRWLSARRGPRPGFCPICRYDLRASPDRCPECGAVPIRDGRV